MMGAWIELSTSPSASSSKKPEKEGTLGVCRKGSEHGFERSGKGNHEEELCRLCACLLPQKK